MTYSKKNIILLILFSFLSSISLSYHYLNKYDNYSKYKQNKHPMIKIAVENHWNEANEIVQDIRKGKSFMVSGQKFSDEYLPGKVLALYYIIIGEELYENDLIKQDNGKFLYLILKTLLYYYAVYFFYTKLLTVLSQKTSFFSVIFLIFLPDLFQYHSSFWNESLFFSFQIIFLSFIINNNFSIIHNISIGFLFSIMYLISQEYIFYFLILILYYLFLKIKFEVSFLKLFFSFLIGFFMLTSVQTYENNLKTGKEQLTLEGIQSALYIYITPKIVAKKDNISFKKATESLKLESVDWANKNNIKYDKKSSFILKISNDNVDDKNQYSTYMFKKSIITILSHPIISTGIFLDSATHLLVLNPFYVKYFYKYNGKGEFLKTEKHQKLIPIRIIYSLIIYGIVFVGFVKSRKSIDSEINLLLFLSILYVVLIGGWLGIPRYFTPALIFMSIYFGIFFGSQGLNLLKTNRFRM